VTPYDVAATIYHLMGIPLDAEIHDHLGRPHALIHGGGQAIPGVVGSAAIIESMAPEH